MGGAWRAPGTAGLGLIGSGLGLKLPVRPLWQMGVGKGPSAKTQASCPNQPGHQGSILASSCPDPNGWQCPHRSRRPGWEPLLLLQRLASPLMGPYGPICSLTAGLQKPLPEDVLCRGLEALGMPPAPAPQTKDPARKTPSRNTLPPACPVTSFKPPPVPGPPTLPLSKRSVISTLPLLFVAHFHGHRFPPKPTPGLRGDKLIHFADLDTEVGGIRGTAQAHPVGAPVFVSLGHRPPPSAQVVGSVIFPRPCPTRDGWRPPPHKAPPQVESLHPPGVENHTAALTPSLDSLGSLRTSSPPPAPLANPSHNHQRELLKLQICSRVPPELPPRSP